MGHCHIVTAHLRPFDGYGQFYGTRSVGLDARPLWVVFGGPQTDALRALFATVSPAPYRTVPIPQEAHITSDDVPYLHRWLSSAAVLVTQSHLTGWGGTGHAALHPSLAPGARMVVCPRLLFTGLHPYQVASSPGLGPSPPVVPYHDLRTVALAAGMCRRDIRSRHPSAEVVQHVAAWSLACQRLRERDCDVSVLDRMRDLGGGAMHAVDRPSNELLLTLARRVVEVLEVRVEIGNPRREVFGDVRAPLEEVVVESLGLPDEPRPDWSVHGLNVTAEEVEEVQLEWYATHPEVLDAVLDAEHLRMAYLGLI